MHRFFVKPEYINDNVVEIRDDDFNHISNSLRLKAGDKIIVSSEDNYEYKVKLKSFKENYVIGDIISKKGNETEPKIIVDIGQSIPKNRNIEFVIQKGTEIGVNEIIPLDTKRTIVKLYGSKEDRRIKRWQSIAKEAAKQSQRGKIPIIKNILDIKDKDNVKDIFKKYDLILIFYTGNGTNNLKSVLKKYKAKDIDNILLLIGPEGGFTEKEVENFINYNDKTECVTLGKRILRTETAGLAALSAILYEFDDLGGY